MKTEIKKIGKFTREIRIDGKPVVCISNPTDVVEIQPNSLTRVILEDEHAQNGGRSRGPKFVVFEPIG